MSQACGSCCFCPSLVEPLTDLHWSRLELLSRENQLPSDTEKQTLAKVEHDIEEYDLAIARLQSAIMSLESQRDVAKDYVSRHKSLLAPIRRLSNDVLGEIFRYLCADTALCIRANGISLPQLYLCLVCKRWRSIVDDSPLLWSTLEFSTSNYPNSRGSISDTTLLNLANLVLARSGNCPLTLTITLYDNVDVHPVFALLFQHADRWLSASVSGHSQGFLSVSSFPQLKHLNFSFGPGDTQNTPAMPSLESLAISQTAHHPLLPNFPWKQLKRLALDTPFLSHYAFVVSRCIQLQHLTLDGWHLNRDSLSALSIASQTIISLTLTYMKEEECEKLFALLQFPQLHVLELDQCDLPAGSTYPFIAHSLSITSLSLKDLNFSLEDLLALLRLLPTVTHFSFYRQSWERSRTILKDFFSNLHHAHPSDSRSLLPRLTHIEMEVVYVYKEGKDNLDQTTSAFVELVKSRVAGNRLKSVRFSVPEYCLNHDLISSLAYLLKVGIAISIQDECGHIL